MKPEHAALLAFFAIILAAAVLTPCLASFGHPWASSAGFAFFRGFCHQLPERSLTVCGAPMPVCARCFGLYCGLFAGSAAYALSPRKSPPAWAAAAAAAPMALDVGARLLGAWAGWMPLSWATGLVLGGILPFYLMPAASEARRRVSAAFIGVRG
jgi:uncharacterized membrane protein